MMCDEEHYKESGRTAFMLVLIYNGSCSDPALIAVIY